MMMQSKRKLSDGFADRLQDLGGVFGKAIAVLLGMDELAVDCDFKEAADVWS